MAVPAAGEVVDTPQLLSTQDTECRVSGNAEVPDTPHACKELTAKWVGQVITQGDKDSETNKHDVAAGTHGRERLEGQGRWPSICCWTRDPIHFKLWWMQLSGGKKEVALSFNLNIHGGIHLTTKSLSTPSLSPPAW